MRLFILIFATLSLGACALKSVQTEYFEKEDLTRFTTQNLKTSKRNKEIELVAVKECAGKIICEDQDIKLTVTHADSFSFLKGKNLDIITEQRQISLNQRDYSNSYNLREKAKDGTSGVLREQFLIWLPEIDFRDAAYAKSAVINVGDYAFELSVGERAVWQILLDAERLLQTMDVEQQREYGRYPRGKDERKKQSLRKKRMVSEAEESTWNLVKDSDNPEDLRYFLEQFPDSPYAVPAKLKLKQLERETQ